MNRCYGSKDDCCCSAVQSCPALPDPMDCSIPGLPVLHCILELFKLCLLMWWCHPTISSSVVPFSSCLQSLPASGSFPRSQFFTPGGQSIEVLPENIQDWFPLGWTGWISLQSRELSRVFSNTTVHKHQFFGTQPSLRSNTHLYMSTGKKHSFDYMDFLSKVMSLLFNVLSKLVTAFLPRSMHLLISRLQSPSAMILEPKKIKSVTFYGFSIYLP